MYRLLLILLLITLTFACRDEKHNFIVDIKVDGANGEMVYLARRTLTGTFMVDSTMPDKSGKYILKGYTAQPDFFILYNNPGSFINLIVHPGDHFSVFTKAESFDQNYIVEGSKDSRLIQKMVTMQSRTLEKITEISERYEARRGTAEFNMIRREIDSIYNQTFAEHKRFSTDLITENPGSLAALMALYQQLGRNAPVFDYKKDFSFYEMVDSSLTGLYPNSEAVIDLNRKVTELRELLKLEEGSVAPEIALPDSTGKIITLSSLRGQYILVIFWASWSSQSDREKSDFVDALSRSATRDVQLYQVSLDRTRESWIKNISSKNSGGIHVSDLKYWDSPVVGTYHIEKLPVTYLINKEGIIVKKGFTAEEFREVIEEFGIN
jgi:peroxiredoxin